MKIYLILLVISGIAYLITNLETRTIIKKYGYQKMREPFVEEIILAQIKTLFMWLLIAPFTLSFIASIFNYEAYEEGICNALEDGIWG
jgi:hypothetical protein